MFDLVKFNQVMVIIIQMIQPVKKQIDKYAISKTPKASLKLELYIIVEALTPAGLYGS